MPTPNMYATNLEKWRADHVLKNLWRVAHGRQRWHGLAPKPLHMNGSRRSDLPGLAIAGAAYLMIRVRALPALGIEEHWLRLYRGDYGRVLEALSEAQRHELKCYLARPQYSSVFRWHSRDRVVSLAHDVEPEVGEAALRIGEVAEPLPLPPKSQ